MKRIVRRFRGRGGMTLVETLVAMLILAMLTSVIVAGSQTALRVYGESTFSSECRTVSDTIDQAFSDVLRYATNVETDSGGNVTAYSNGSYGIADGAVRIGTSEADRDYGMIYLYYGGAGNAENIFLLSNLSYSGLAVVPVDYSPETDGTIGPFDLRYSGGVFTGRYRLYNPKNHLLSDVFGFSFRSVNS